MRFLPPGRPGLALPHGDQADAGRNGLDHVAVGTHMHAGALQELAGLVVQYSVSTKGPALIPYRANSSSTALMSSFDSVPLASMVRNSSLVRG